jgi:hypothetical protein
LIANLVFVSFQITHEGRQQFSNAGRYFIGNRSSSADEKCLESAYRSQIVKELVIRLSVQIFDEGLCRLGICGLGPDGSRVRIGHAILFLYYASLEVMRRNST